MSNPSSGRPSDRPDHPPVWVRGGPPYYYMPTRPSIPTSPSETLRRASTTSTLSSSPEISLGGTLSPPPKPRNLTRATIGIPTPLPFFLLQQQQQQQPLPTPPSLPAPAPGIHGSATA
ncbi:hypothetical protein ACJ72_02810 [Emergomyces africanus]|uniref:Uncharacterized protein n=1 Tax=Emergomyces africanus TaxID=1955775 RepID=A0A1B7P1E6_9EURO|nr:hypothetical protein ACJ72_02810 [Emergomyces africanus]